MRQSKKLLSAALVCGILAGASCYAPAAVWAADTQKPSAAAVKTGTEAQKTYDLTFHPEKGIRESKTYQNQQVDYYAYRNIVYVSKPKNVEYESMNLFVPAAYLEGKSVNGYTAQTAPIFLPNKVGGYMPGTADEPQEKDRMSGGPNAALVALSKGYVVAAPAIRGRTTQGADGAYVGKAPALIVDYKAAVRYLRHNQLRLPAGNTERIISNGTSAGGALSALLGATGNSKDYEAALKKIGAAEERDDIYASSDYCPITNLSHADMAYEWVFNGVNFYHQNKMPGGLPGMPGAYGMPQGAPKAAAASQKGAAAGRPENAPQETQSVQVMSKLEQETSDDLKKLFPAYVNSLGLKDPSGRLLTLDKKGQGSFADYIKSVYLASAQTALAAGQDLSGLDWLTIQNGKAVAMDLGKYAVYATRLKAAPAFDKLDGTSGENDEFGTSSNVPRHFTEYSLKHRTDKNGLAPAEDIKLLSPLAYIGKRGVTVAPHWRIRHGSVDRDTAIAIPAILALKLQNTGADVNFAAVWGKGHAGDYDLDQLFAWMDSICH